MIRRFLALDQSLSSCGFALWDEGDALPRSGAWPLCNGIKQRALAFVGLHREIATIHRERQIALLGHEEPIKVPTDKLDKIIALYGLVAHIESLAHVKIIPVVSYGARTWRASFFAKEERDGKRPDQLKRMAIERCRQYGMDPSTNDEAEAIGILDHMLLDQRIMPPWREANPFLAILG